MNKKVMICYDYENDLWRVNRVVNTWITKGYWDVSGYADAESWKNIKLRGTYGVNRWMSDELHGTSATLVLVGSLTSKQSYVMHVLDQSIKQGNGIVLVDIHSIRDQDLRIGSKGQNPIDLLTASVPPAGRVLHYDWVSSDGAKNLDAWLDRVEKPR